MDRGSRDRTVIRIDSGAPDSPCGRSCNRELERLTGAIAETHQVGRSGDHVSRNGTGRSRVVAGCSHGATTGERGNLGTRKRAIVDSNLIEITGEKIESIVRTTDGEHGAGKGLQGVGLNISENLGAVQIQPKSAAIVGHGYVSPWSSFARFQSRVVAGFIDTP